MFEQALGIILHPEKVYLCQANRGLNSLEITHYVFRYIPEEIRDKGPQKVGDWLRDLCIERGIQPDIIYSALPTGSSMFRHLHLPFTDINKLTRVYPFEIEQTLPCSLDEVVMDFQVLKKERTSGTDILVSIVPKVRVEEHLEILRAANLEPQVTTLEPIGLLFFYQTILPHKPPSGECIINVGSKEATMVIIEQGKILLAREIALTDISILCDQIGLTLTSYFTNLGKTFERVILTGSPDPIKKLELLIPKRMGIETKTIHPFDGIPTKIKLESIDMKGVSATPVGLCMCKRFKRGVQWNFRQDRYAYQKTYTLPRKKALSIATFLLILIILGSLNLAARSWSYKNKLRILENEAQKILSQVLPGKKLGPDTEAMLKKMLEREEIVQKQYKAFLGNGVSAIDILRELSIRIPQEYDVSVQEILFQDGKVSIKGRADTFEMLDKLKTSLGKSKIINEIKIDEAKIKGKNNHVTFNILLELGSKG